MTKKRLPKAITRASETRPRADSDTATSEPRKRAPAGQNESRAAAMAEGPARRSSAAPDAAEPASTPAAAAPLEGEVLSATSDPVDASAERRLAVARQVVERYKVYAALGGLTFLPILSVAAVMTAIMRMVKTLSTLYGVPFEHERTRSIVVGLMGGAVPTGLGVAAASALTLLVPGAGFVGVAVSTVTAAEVTNRIGSHFVDRFEQGVMAAAAPSTEG